MLGTFSAEPIAGEIQARHSPVILWIAVNNSSSTSGQMEMKTVPKRP
jgi:hypothetical protein